MKKNKNSDRLYPNFKNDSNFSHIRSLKMREGLEIIKRNCPMTLEKAIALLSFEFGFAKKNSKDIVMTYYDMEKITIKDNIVRIKGDPDDSPKDNG